MNPRTGASSRPDWIMFRRWLAALQLGALAVWWALWDWLHPARNSVVARGIVARPIMFFAVPVSVVFALHVGCNYLETVFGEQKWRPGDAWRRAFWQTVSPVTALLLAAKGFDAIYAHRLAGLDWLSFAGIAGFCGTLRLRSAEGIRLQLVKSGELFKRAFAMAKGMKIPLQSVYIVPSGREI